MITLVAKIEINIPVIDCKTVSKIITEYQSAICPLKQYSQSNKGFEINLKNLYFRHGSSLFAKPQNQREINPKISLGITKKLIQV